MPIVLHGLTYWGIGTFAMGNFASLTKDLNSTISSASIWSIPLVVEIAFDTN